MRRSLVVTCQIVPVAPQRRVAATCPFGSLVRAALLGATLLLGACDGPPERDEPWHPIYIPPDKGCSPTDNFPVSASNLNPGEPVDYLAIHRVDSARVASGEAPTVSYLSAWGNACAGREHTECVSPLAALPTPDARCEGSSCGDAIVTRRGSVVQRWPMSGRLWPLLEPIDTPAEALLIVRGQGWAVSCEDVRAEVTDAGTVYTVTVSQPTGRSVSQADGCAFAIELEHEIRVASDRILGSGDPREVRRPRGCP
jgi:hypothetical protein